MAITDLIDRLSGSTGTDDGNQPDGPEFTAPDDLSGLDEGLDLTPDPKPARRRTRTAIPSAAGRATAAQKKAVRDAWLMLLTPTTGLWSMRDPHCGGAAFAQREAIADAMVPIICRNPAWLRFFTSGDAAWLHYVALATALQPVGAAVFAHHVRHSVGGGDGAGGEAVDYSAYTAG